ncbi:MAG: hypothetical protein ABH896_00280 [Candidatus Jacksonbacteria bacterium]
MIIYLIGNPLLDCDSMPLKLKPHLQKAFPDVKFLEFDPTEDWPDDREPIFIDTVINLKKPKLFTDVDPFESAGAKNLSVHGFDFYQELELRQKVGLLQKFWLIGIPPNSKMMPVAQQTIELIKLFFKF